MIKKSQGLSQGRLTGLRACQGGSPRLSPGTSSEGAWALECFGPRAEPAGARGPPALAVSG
jgi:hypothetical protein